MGRVIAIHQGPDGRHRPGPPNRDDRMLPVIDFVRQAGMLGQPFLVPVRFTENTDQAEDVRRSLYNAARYYCSCGSRNCHRKYGNLPVETGGCPDGGQRISCQARLVRRDGHVRVEVTLFDKREAIRQIIATYGPDPENWPYLAKRKKIKEP